MKPRLHRVLPTGNPWLEDYLKVCYVAPHERAVHRHPVFDPPDFPGGSLFPCGRTGKWMSDTSTQAASVGAPQFFPPGLSNAFWFATFNALSYQMILGSPMVLFAKSMGASIVPM